MTLPHKPNSPLLLLLPHHDQDSDTTTQTATTTADHAPNLLDFSSSSSSSSSPLPPEEITGLERLKRHRVAVAGHVWIPDKWGKEDLLKDWIDGSAFEASLFPSGVVSARLALTGEAKRLSPNNNTATVTTAAAAASGALRILNRC